MGPRRSSIDKIGKGWDTRLNYANTTSNSFGPNALEQKSSWLSNRWPIGFFVVAVGLFIIGSFLTAGAYIYTSPSGCWSSSSSYYENHDYSSLTTFLKPSLTRFSPIRHRVLMQTRLSSLVYFFSLARPDVFPA